jgi:hypothetical protein
MSDPEMQEAEIKPYTPTLVVAQAIISLIPMRSKPPVSAWVDCHSVIKKELRELHVLLFTMDIYSSSEGHCRESRHRISRP